MGKKIIKLTESDLTKIVNRVILEQSKLNSNNNTLLSAISNFPDAKKRTFSVLTVKGRPSIKKDNKDLLLTKGMKINPTDLLKFQTGDEVTMKSISPEDGGRYFQQVNLSLNPNGKLEIFVYSD
jgi:hypothetical protein